MQEFSEVEAVASRNRSPQFLATNAARAVTMVTVFGHNPVPMRKSVTVTGLLATANFREFIFYALR
jgi:hypothetical protein